MRNKRNQTNSRTVYWSPDYATPSLTREANRQTHERLLAETEQAIAERQLRMQQEKMRFSRDMASWYATYRDEFGPGQATLVYHLQGEIARQLDAGLAERAGADHPPATVSILTALASGVKKLLPNGR